MFHSNPMPELNSSPLYNSVLRSQLEALVGLWARYLTNTMGHVKFTSDNIFFAHKFFNLLHQCRAMNGGQIGISENDSIEKVANTLSGFLKECDKRNLKPEQPRFHNSFVQPVHTQPRPAVAQPSPMDGVTYTTPDAPPVPDMKAGSVGQQPNCPVRVANTAPVVFRPAAIRPVIMPAPVRVPVAAPAPVRAPLVDPDVDLFTSAFHRFNFLDRLSTTKAASNFDGCPVIPTVQVDDDEQPAKKPKLG